MFRRPQTAARLLLALLLVCFTCGCLCEDNPLNFTTDECSLIEPVYGHKFDFSKLHSDFAHLATSDKGDTFEYNICGNLTRNCAGRSNVAACLKRDNKEFVLGTQHQLHYRNGKMYFSFANGDKCPSGDQFQLYVFIGCDYTLDKNQSQVTAYADDACSFYITLETPKACLPEPAAVEANTCSVKDPQTGHTYDLLPLSDFNYRTTDRMGSAFVINVCKPVLYGENAMCPSGSSICFISLKSANYTKKFFDYGTVQANPTIENGQLLMRHASPTPCNATANYSSIVYFVCDKNVKNAHPEMIGFHGCVYEFSFVTPLACNNLAPCTAITHGSELIDMSALQNQKPLTLILQEKSYTFAVCSQAGQPCLENNGACITSGGQSTSLGTSNSHLRIDQTGSPYLLYEGGATCQKSEGSATSSSSSGSTTTFWSTKIEFVCANNATKDNASTSTSSGSSTSSSSSDDATPAKIIENSNCQLQIHYQTALACHEQITCKAKVYVEHSEDGTGEEVLDLTPLISANENYEAHIDASTITEQQVSQSTKFFLNVCRPLVPTFGLGCPGDSAACMAKMISSSPTPEEEQSLGSPLASLVAINRTSAELRYLKGGACPTDKNSQLSSGIEFHCDMRAGRGTPVLRTISDCHYQFTWATNVICPPHMCNFNADTCEIINDDINVSYNLRKAPFTQDGDVKVKTDKGEFTLSVCGTHRKAVTDYSQSLVNLFFAAKGPCGVDGLVSVQMRLICSSDTELATSFSDDTQCNLVYIQRTPDICKFLGLEIPAKTTTAKPPGDSVASTAAKPSENNGGGGDHPAERTGSIGAILAAILSLTFFVACFGVLAFSPERRNSVRRLFRRSTSAVRYSRVTNEEANLLLEPNGEFTDSDDDMLL